MFSTDTSLSSTHSLPIYLSEKEETHLIFGNREYKVFIQAKEKLDFFDHMFKYVSNAVGQKHYWIPLHVDLNQTNKKMYVLFHTLAETLQLNESEKKQVQALSDDQLQAYVIQKIHEHLNSLYTFQSTLMNQLQKTKNEIEEMKSLLTDVQVNKNYKNQNMLQNHLEDLHNYLKLILHQIAILENTYGSNYRCFRSNQAFSKDIESLFTIFHSSTSALEKIKQFMERYRTLVEKYLPGKENDPDALTNFLDACLFDYQSKQPSLAKNVYSFLLTLREEDIVDNPYITKGNLTIYDESIAKQNNVRLWNLYALQGIADINLYAL